MEKHKTSPVNSKPPATAQTRAQPRKPKKITETYLHNAGLYYLQRFAASKAQFRDVMLRKVRKSCRAHPDQDEPACVKMVSALVDKFTTSGLLNDESFTRGVVTSTRRLGKSRRAIAAKLKTRGITAPQIEAALAEYDERETPGGIDAESRAAVQFARRKRLGPFKKDENTDVDKMLGAMARAGFSYDTSRRVLEMDLEEAESLLRA